MTWSSAFVALLVSHLVGDVLLQTDWQAVHKVGGFGDPLARRALVRHLLSYTLAFLPALIWVGLHSSAFRATCVALLIAIPHLAIDDGTIVRLWLRKVKRVPHAGLALSIAVDQSLHVVCLLFAAVFAAA